MPADDAKWAARKARQIADEACGSGRPIEAQMGMLAMAFVLALMRHELDPLHAVKNIITTYYKLQGFRAAREKGN